MELLDGRGWAAASAPDFAIASAAVRAPERLGPDEIPELARAFATAFGNRDDVGLPYEDVLVQGHDAGSLGAWVVRLDDGEMISCGLGWILQGCHPSGTPLDELDGFKGCGPIQVIDGLGTDHGS